MIKIRVVQGDVWGWPPEFRPALYESERLHIDRRLAHTLDNIRVEIQRAVKLTGLSVPEILSKAGVS